MGTENVRDRSYKIHSICSVLQDEYVAIVNLVKLCNISKTYIRELLVSLEKAGVVKSKIEKGKLYFKLSKKYDPNFDYDACIGVTLPKKFKVVVDDLQWLLGGKIVR